MIINNWYVAAQSSDVKKGEPFSVKMLGCDFVLFRSEDGSVVCLSDTCCHRGAALSHGTVEDGCIQCPFHGWRFNTEGKCVAIPSMGEDFPIPDRAKVDCYPVEEKYDLVWAFLGDLPEEERPPVPALLEEYYDTDTWRTTTTTFEAPLNWTKAEENNIDTAHLPFVHATFGMPQDPTHQSVPIERKPFGARVARERTAPKASQKSGVLGELLKEERKKTKVSLEFSLAGVCHRIQPEFRPGMSMITFAAITPIDPWNTRFFTRQTRNYAIEPEHDEERLVGQKKAREEDLSVNATVRPRLGPTPTRDQVLVKSDEMEVLFRQYVVKLIERGWELDYDKMQAEYDHKVYVIPSPERRTNPKGWIYDAAPTTRPRADQDDWPSAEWVK